MVHNWNIITRTFLITVMKRRVGIVEQGGRAEAFIVIAFRGCRFVEGTVTT